MQQFETVGNVSALQLSLGSLWGFLFSLIKVKILIHIRCLSWITISSMDISNINFDETTFQLYIYNENNTTSFFSFYT